MRELRTIENPTAEEIEAALEIVKNTPPDTISGYRYAIDEKERMVCVAGTIWAGFADVTMTRYIEVYGEHLASVTFFPQYRGTTVKQFPKRAIEDIAATPVNGAELAKLTGIHKTEITYH